MPNSCYCSEQSLTTFQVQLQFVVIAGCLTCCCEEITEEVQVQARSPMRWLLLVIDILWLCACGSGITR